MSDSPISEEASMVIANAKRRYHATRPEHRPSLERPRDYVGLFSDADLVRLARLSLWPLPAWATAFIASPIQS
jgi:hypothetical protein